MPARSQWFSFCIGLTNSVQPYCMFESMTVQATISANCAQRLIGVSARDGVMSFDPRLTGKVRHRDGYAAVAERDIHQRQSHLHAGERAGQHQLVEISEVPDTEDAACQLAEARPEGHIEALEDQRTQRRLVVAIGKQDG